MRLHHLLLIAILSTSSISIFGEINEKDLLKEVEALIQKQDEVNSQISKIKELLGLGSALEGLGLLETTNEDEQVKSLTAKAKPLFEAKKYSEAKDLLQDAWESDPSSQVASYNLGLSYARMNRPILAKKFLKQAVDAKIELDNKEQVLSYLRGEKESIVSVKQGDSKLQTELTNLQKETDSLLRSTHVSGPEKIKLVISSIESLKEKVKNADKDEHVENYYTYISDAYSAFEMYSEALDALNSYEKSMKGKVLPDDFFTKKLDLENKSLDQKNQMNALLNKEISEDQRYQLSNDIHELKVFASQMNEFVALPNLESSDFSMICKRLGEYPWGKKPNRHVLVLSRFQEILYSSLEGTFPIERYRDVKGNQFLKCIVQTLPSEMPLKEVKMISVDLNVNGKIIPYVILYTYVPKIDSYIVVRINQDDLRS